jgi:hypothetical protein
MTEQQIEEIEDLPEIEHLVDVEHLDINPLGNLTNKLGEQQKTIEERAKQTILIKIDQQYNLYDYLAEYRRKDLDNLSVKELTEHLETLERLLVGKDIKFRYDSEYHALGLVLGTVSGLVLSPSLSNMGIYMENDKATRQNYYRIRSKYYVPYLDSSELGLGLGVMSNMITCYQNNPNFEGKVSNTFHVRYIMHSEKIINNSYILKYQVLLDKYK